MSGALTTLSAFSQPSVGGGTPAQGNLLGDEGFETPITGYERTGWNAGTGSPDPAYSIASLTTNKPNGAGAQGFRSNYSASGVWVYNSWSSGSTNSSTVYVRFYMYVASHDISTSNSVDIAGVFNNYTEMTQGGWVAGVRMQNTASQLSIRAVGATSSAVVNISTGQWILVELKVVPDGASELKVNGGSAQTFTATGYTQWISVGIGSFASSANAYTYNDTIFDLVAADSTGYIGPTP